MHRMLNRSNARGRRDAQQGIVMWVALVVLIVMTLAGLAMVRQASSGLSIAGNIAFKESATSSADAGTEVARGWFTGQSTLTLDSDSPAQGYFSTWNPSVDPTTFPWDNANSVPVILDASVGNTSRYRIERLCQITGSSTASNQVCSDLPDDSGQSHGGPSYNSPTPQTPVFKPYFRVTTQVTGPRNTVSYTQVILN